MSEAPRLEAILRHEIETLNRKLDAYFDLIMVRRDADIEAIERWMNTGGKRPALNSRGDLLIWLLGELKRMETEFDNPER